MTERVARPNSRQFTRLSEAVDFIARCLEADGVADLYSELVRTQKHTAWRPDSLEHFSEFVFPPLRAVHIQKDLRQLYRGKDFPAGDGQFNLGGHMAELGCIHIDFERRELGWLLVDIWICR